MGLECRVRHKLREGYVSCATRWAQKAVPQWNAEEEGKLLGGSLFVCRFTLPLASVSGQTSLMWTVAVLWRQVLGALEETEWYLSHWLVFYRSERVSWSTRPRWAARIHGSPRYPICGPWLPCDQA